LQIIRPDARQSWKGWVKFFRRNRPRANNGVGQNAQFYGVGVDNDDLVEVGQTRLRQIKELLDVDDGQDLPPYIDQSQDERWVCTAAE
jgi:hypothetical protein